MGGAACEVVIIEGNIAYAVTELFQQRNPKLNTTFLEAAVKASCDGIHHASLYFEIDREDGDNSPELLTSEYTQPIIDLHRTIINDLSHGKSTQSILNSLTISLFTATRKLYLLFGTMPTGLLNIESLLNHLNLEGKTE